MSLKMAQGSDSGVAMNTWQSYDDNMDASTRSSDRKMSSAEAHRSGHGQFGSVVADDDRRPSSAGFGISHTTESPYSSLWEHHSADTSARSESRDKPFSTSVVGFNPSLTSHQYNHHHSETSQQEQDTTNYNAAFSDYTLAASRGKESRLPSGTNARLGAAGASSGYDDDFHNAYSLNNSNANSNAINTTRSATTDLSPVALFSTATTSTPESNPSVLPPVPNQASRTRTPGSTSEDAQTRMGFNEAVIDSLWGIEDTLSNSNKMDRSSEGKFRDGDDSTVQSTAVLSTGSHEGDILSPASTPRAGPAEPLAHLEAPAGAHPILGTPSTVSTVPSTDDASLELDFGSKIDPNLLEPFTLHRRAPSWDRSPVQRIYSRDNEGGAAASGGSLFPNIRQIPNVADSSQYWLPQHHQPSPAQAYAQSQPAPAPWGNPRVATFRGDAGVVDSRYSQQMPHGDQRWHQPPQSSQQHHQRQQQQPPRHFAQEQQISYLAHAQSQAGRGASHPDAAGGHGYRTNPGYNPYQLPRKTPYPQQHPQNSGPHQHSHSLPPSQSPRRERAPRPQGPSPHRPPQAGGPAGPSSGTGSSSRSASEILKTLLRKKACLYEPDTSRAVALVTWLVGRELALEYGFFSRQQLQAGVHACVADKIDNGTITRTKVNRCMQIILNSCFHYIIPRPDGTEEKGSTFKEHFKDEVHSDAELLRHLPVPWNDLSVDRQKVLEASAAEMEMKPEPSRSQQYASPKGSPSLKPMADRGSPGRDAQAADDDDTKRAVLLCFNENVRAAEDVFRCHNEFIRDSAHSSNLQLSASEWRVFFGKEAANTPRIWGNVGIPVVSVETGPGVPRKADALGQLTPDEAGKFRTTWCAKRYDHDHGFCGMAHVEVDGGWLRRNPNIHRYQDELCPHVTKIADKRVGPNYFVINECPKGVHCEFAHSHEELTYHPKRYKGKVCQVIMRTGTCRFGDICPNHHPVDSARPPKKGEGRPPSSRHGRSQAQSGAAAKNAVAMPTGSPILYASPAPISSYEKHLLMPGLQNLFRRQCSVVRAHLRNPPKCKCCYSYFGDDTGLLEKDQPASTTNARPGLPPPSAPRT